MEIMKRKNWRDTVHSWGREPYEDGVYEAWLREKRAGKPVLTAAEAAALTATLGPPADQFTIVEAARRQRLAGDFLAALMRSRRPGEIVGVDVRDDGGLELYVSVGTAADAGHCSTMIDYATDGLSPDDIANHVAETFRRAREEG